LLEMINPLFKWCVTAVFNVVQVFPRVGNIYADDKEIPFLWNPMFLTQSSPSS